MKFFIKCNLTPTAVYEYLSEALRVSVDVLYILWQYEGGEHLNNQVRKASFETVMAEVLCNVSISTYLILNWSG